MSSIDKNNAVCLTKGQFGAFMAAFVLLAIGFAGVSVVAWANYGTVRELTALKAQMAPASPQNDLYLEIMPVEANRLPAMRMIGIDSGSVRLAIGEVRLFPKQRIGPNDVSEYGIYNGGELVARARLKQN